MDRDRLIAALTPAGGALKLSAASLTANVGPFLSLIDGGPEVTIAHAEIAPAPDGGPVTVTGACSVHSVTDAPTTVTATLDGAGDVQLVIRCAIPAASPGAKPWTFSSSFADLPQTPDWAKTLLDPTSSPLDTLSLTDQAFVLSTRAATDAVTGVTLEAGLNFVATLAPTGLLAVVAGIFGLSETPTLHGTIVLPPADATAPELAPGVLPWDASPQPPPGISLRAGLGLNPAVHALTLSGFGVRVYSPPSNAWMALNPSYTPLAALLGTLEIPSAGKLSGSFVAPVESGADALDVSVDFANASLGGLAALVDAVGTGGLAQQLPTGIGKLGDLQLTHLGLGLAQPAGNETASGTPTVTWVSATVGMPHLDWDVWPGKFAVDSLLATFTVTRPFESASVRYGVIVAGRLEIDGVPVDLTAGSADGFVVAIAIPRLAFALGGTTLTVTDVRATAAGIGTAAASYELAGTLIIGAVSFRVAGGYASQAWSIAGALATTEPVTLSGLVAALRDELGMSGTPAIPDDFLTVAIAKAGISYAERAGQDDHALSFDVELKNVLDFGSTFSIDKLAASLALTGTTLTSAVLEIDLILCGVELVLRAVKAQSGWQFTGGTQPGQKISFGALVEDLGSKFGQFSLPAPLAKVTIDQFDVAFDLDGSNFSVDVKGTIPVAGDTLAIDVSLARAPRDAPSGTATFTADAWITLAIPQAPQPDREERFHVHFDESGADDAKSFSFSWAGAAGRPALSLRDLAGRFTSDLDAIPAELSFALTEVWLGATDAGAVIIAADLERTRVLLATLPGVDSGPRVYAGAFEVDVAAGLSKLPVIGSHLSDRDLALQTVQFVASNGLSADQAKQIGQALPKSDPNLPKQLPTLPSGARAAGLSVGAVLTVTGERVELPLAGSPLAPAPVPVPAPTPVATAAGVPAGPLAPAAPGLWKPIGRTIGPLALRRVGVAWSQGRAWLLLDAGFAMAGLAVDLDGLGLGLTVALPPKPAPALHGLSVGLQAGPVELAGGLIEVKPGQYDGEIKVNIEAFELIALGSWATIDGHPSLFVFAMLNEPPLGGPEFFYVTGLAFGFGYNRSLRLPTLDELPQYPFVTAAMAGTKPGANPFSSPDPTAALTYLNEHGCVPPTEGENWIAAGVRFKSFELLQSFALLTVQFGREIEIALLGLSVMSVPTEVPEPIAYAELALEASFSTATGLVALSAQLTPQSYILSKDCQLTGGFAFYLWTKAVEGQPPPGEFVLTLGGYHPRFTPPRGYPSVPRIGANWKVSSALVVKAGLYFALTPSCVMAGGSLEAAWKSGGLQLTFTAEADFLLGWKPFHYSVDISVTLRGRIRVHVIVTITISFHLGVALSLWGPPFGGKAHVDLDVVSFTISFGSHRSGPKPIPWAEFKTSFLPPPAPAPSDGTADTRPAALAAPPAPTPAPIPSETWCGTRILGGLEQDLTQQAGADVHWVVNGEQVVLQTFTVVPCTKATILTPAADAHDVPAAPPAFGIGPAGVPDGEFESEHAVKIRRVDHAGSGDPTAQLAVVARTADLPRALWSADAALNANIGTINNTPATLSGMVTGLDISSGVLAPDQTAPVLVSTLEDEPNDFIRFGWKPAATAAPAGPGGFAATLEAPAVVATRTAIAATLRAAGAPLPAAPDAGRLQAAVAGLMSAEPVIAAVGC
jgi:hypothetical protein